MPPFYEINYSWSPLQLDKCAKTFLSPCMHCLSPAGDKSFCSLILLKGRQWITQFHKTVAYSFKQWWQWICRCRICKNHFAKKQLWDLAYQMIWWFWHHVSASLPVAPLHVLLPYLFFRHCYKLATMHNHPRTSFGAPLLRIYWWQIQLHGTSLMEKTRKETSVNAQLLWVRVRRSSGKSFEILFLLILII